MKLSDNKHRDLTAEAPVRYADPRGPDRLIVTSGPERGVVVLSCGHRRELNPIYTYRVGDRCRCFTCAKENRS